MVTVHEPDQPFLYWGLTLTSPWMESFDYRYTTTAPQQRDGQRSDDGSLATGHRARAEPGRDNWLDTGGRLEGYMLVRWVLADGPPHPTAEVVDLDSRRPDRRSPASDLGGDAEALLVGGDQGPVRRQVETGVGEGVVVAAGTRRCGGRRDSLEVGAEVGGDREAPRRRTGPR